MTKRSKVVVVGTIGHAHAGLFAAIEKLSQVVACVDECPPYRERWPSRHLEEMLLEPVPMKNWWFNPGLHFGDPWNGTWDQRAVRILRKLARLRDRAQHTPAPRPRRRHHVTPRGKNWSHIDYGRRLGRKR